MAEKIQYEGRDLRVVYMGTPSFAVPSLEAVARVADVTLVFTRPDAVRGRGKTLEPSPIKAKAAELGLPIYEAKRIDDAAFAALQAAKPDLIVLAAYGVLLAERVLELPALGCVNVHASLLPRWRGAAPVQRAVLEGDERIGVSIMELVSEMDAGRYCAQAWTTAGDKMSEELLAELAQIGADALVEALPSIADGSAEWVEQDESQVTFAPKIPKEEMLLGPELAADRFVRQVRASTDAAPARMQLAGKGLRVLQARVADADSLPAVPKTGEYLKQKSRILLGVSDGCVELLEVKPDGKKAMPVSAWAAGVQKKSGTWERV